MFFRPEEVHPASSQAPGDFPSQNLGERDIHMSHGGRWIDFQDLFVLRPDDDGLPAIQATGIDPDFGTGKKPAHGQRFDSSLSVPLLVSLDRHKIMGGYIREWRPRLDIIDVISKPAPYG